MLAFLIGVFLVLHGLVHLLYVALSRGLIDSEREIGWTGKSWLFSNLLGQAGTLRLASAAYTLATLAFIGGGVGILSGAHWWQTVTAGAAILSSVVILLFWDGSTDRVVNKGLLGVLINVIILAAVLGLRWLPTPS